MRECGTVHTSNKHWGLWEEQAGRWAGVGTILNLFRHVVTLFQHLRCPLSEFGGHREVQTPGHNVEVITGTQHHVTSGPHLGAVGEECG